MQDNKLWKSLSEDDYSAFNTIVDRYYSALLTFSFSITKCYEESQDVVQELFVYLWANRKRMDSYLSLRSFLYTSTRNRSLNYLRSVSREEQFLDRGSISDDGFINELIVEEVYQQLDSSIRSLPERNQVVVRHTMKGTRMKEIADILDVSLRTVNTIKADSFEQLRRVLNRALITN